VPAFHEPVLVEPLCDALAPAFNAGSGVLVDVTCGGGGHTKAVLERVHPQQVYAFDRDADALAHAAVVLADAECPIELVHARFSRVAERLAEVDNIRAIVADLGVSSHQLGTQDRGFSFRLPAPLDMRMDRSRGRSAAELVSEIDAASLARILRDFGDEPDARRIAEAIVRVRPVTTTALAQVVTDAMSGRQRRALGRRIHPATRTFSALRIAVNDELAELEALLEQAPALLIAGGRFGVITFHSAEDRVVKRRFRALSRVDGPPAQLPIPDAELPRAEYQLPAGYRSPTGPTAAELEANPRARSARLRVLERVTV
jgi:16S rRNA (cytosine1402-N4)-methyltransferase